MNNGPEVFLQTSYGPVQSLAIGPIKIDLELDGEIVRGAFLRRGYAHKAVEKIAEKLTWIGNLPLVERVDYLASIHYSVAYCQAVEMINSIKVPPRAEHIRVLVLELNRISSHLFFLHKFCHQIGADAAAMYFLRDREILNNLFEALCGARLTHNYLRIGGVGFDVTDGFLEKTKEALEYISTKTEEYDALLFSNPIFQGRTQNVGPLSVEDIIKFGIGGSSARSCGITDDLRYDQPYAGYRGFIDGFDRPVYERRSSCDVYNRVLQRTFEIKESIDLIARGLKQIPGGPYHLSIKLSDLCGAGSAFSEVEGPRGRIGIWLTSDGGSRPARVRFLGPSLNNCAALPGLLRGVMLGDVSTVVMSMDICMSEVDR